MHSSSPAGQQKGILIPSYSRWCLKQAGARGGDGGWGSDHFVAPPPLSPSHTHRMMIT